MVSCLLRLLKVRIPGAADLRVELTFTIRLIEFGRNIWKALF